MIHAILSAFSQLADPMVLLLLVIGSVAGFVVGLLPGIGSIVAISLLLPFTFNMTSFQAFALLLGLYAVVTTAGDVTSILVGIPAHPECAAMVLDGYPLARKGEAGRAIAAAVYSSTIGAVIGAVVLAASIPIMQLIVLHIGAGELFMLAVVGVAMVGAVSGEFPLQGAVMGGIGLLLAAVGPDVQTGIIRFGFNEAYLVGGIPLVPLAVGLFGIPELFRMHARRKETLGEKTEITDTGLRTGWKDNITHWSVVLRGSIVGVVVGVAPGLGNALAQWAAYGQAVQTSKTPERFGHGAIEGVLAPGASTHSKEGAGLIPTVAFGVPGSGAMAVLLGAFLILGLDPGPSMLSEHLDVTYFMVIVLIVASVLGSALCLALIRPLAGVAKLRASVLVPIVMFLVFIGAAATTGQMGDLIVMLISGVGAWAVTRQHWPIVPVVLGYVLGKSAEPNLFIAQRSYGWAFLERPIVIGLIVLAALVVVWSVRMQRRQRGLQGSVGGDGISPRERATSWKSLVIAGVLTVLAALAVLLARHWPRDARLYPTIIGTATAVLGLLCVLFCLHGMLQRRRARHAERVEDSARDSLAASVEAVSVPQRGMPPNPGAVRNTASGAGTQVAAMSGSAERRGEVVRKSVGGDELDRGLVSASDGDSGGVVQILVQDMPAEPPVRRELSMFLWIGGMFVGAWLFGFGVIGVGFALVYLIFACREKLRIAVPIAIGIWLLYFLVFTKVLDITLPTPVFGFA